MELTGKCKDKLKEYYHNNHTFEAYIENKNSLPIFDRVYSSTRNEARLECIKELNKIIND